MADRVCRKGQRAHTSRGPAPSSLRPASLRLSRKEIQAVTTGQRHSQRSVLARASDVRRTIQRAAEPSAAPFGASGSSAEQPGTGQPAVPEETSSRDCAVTRRFFACLSNRDLAGMLELLHPDAVYSNASLQVRHVGKQAVVKWYNRVIGSLPQTAELVVHDIVSTNKPLGGRRTGPNRNSGAARHVTVAWRLEIGGLPVPASEGVGIIQLDPSTGLILAINDTPKMAVRFLLPALTLATPAVDALAPVWLPAASALKQEIGQAVTPSLGNSNSGSANPPDLLLEAANALSGLLPAPPLPTLPWATGLYGNTPASSMLPQTDYPTDYNSNRTPAATQPPVVGPNSMAGTTTFPPASADSPPSAHQSNGSSGGRAAGAQEPAAASAAAPSSSSEHSSTAHSHASQNSKSSHNGHHTHGHHTNHHSNGHTHHNRHHNNNSNGYSQPAQPYTAAYTGPRPYNASAESNGSSNGVYNGSSRQATAATAAPLQTVVAVALETGQDLMGSVVEASFDDVPVGSTKGIDTTVTAASARTEAAAGTAASAAAASATPAAATASAPSAAAASASSNGASNGAAASHGTASYTADNTANGGAASNGVTNGAAASSPTVQNVSLTGVWEKDTEASQPEQYERMLDVLGLQGLQRVTARLIEGIDIQDDKDNFTVNFLTVVPFFKVTEKVRYGSSVKLMRRDLKPGQQSATAARTPAGGVRVSFEWGAPAAGSLDEQYEMMPGERDRMSVTSQLNVGGNTARVVQVYKRTGKDKDALLRESRARNNSFEGVLAKQKARWGS